MIALYYFFLVSFLIVCFLTCFVILIQESKSLGLGASFGGNSGDSLFGTSTAAVLKKFTAYMVGIFMVSCLVLSFWTAHLGRRLDNPITPLQEEVLEEEIVE